MSRNLKIFFRKKERNLCVAQYIFKFLFRLKELVFGFEVEVRILLVQ